ncbi:LLM class flavin-dependent oxidoreductase [Amycolatopsis sp. NPDC021455]|uniref:LLM class flavin-dependent oxidoreductase n=1 Tax=Amycolatopsis sp. NPDC021455 TaxID=3154901 RepID=UPI0034047F54
MKYGISLLPDSRAAIRPAAQYYDDVLRLAELADRLGFHYVKMTEHYLHEYGGYCPSPLNFLTAVAARTERIRLMTGGIQASFHHPVQLAAETAQVDVLSGGRLDVGFARAFLPYEFRAFGVDMDTSRAQFQATLDAVQRLWTETKVSERTPFFSYDDATSFPAPVQAPHPPVWVAAIMSPRSFSWAGEKGFKLLMASPPQPDDMARAGELVKLYRDAFTAAHGEGGPEAEVGLSIPLVVADTDEEAAEIATPLLRAHWEVWGEAAESVLTVDSPDYQGYGAVISKTLNRGDSEVLDGAITGSPATVAAKVGELRDALSLDTIVWQIDFGGQPFEVMERSLRLFAEKSLPLVK